MKRIDVRHCWMGLALVGYVLLGGCGKKEYTAPPIDETLLAGNWVQIEEKKASPRQAKQGGETKSVVRHLTINADKTFVFTVHDASGKPIGDKKAEGSLAVNVEQHEITYTVSNNTFKPGDPGADWVPAVTYTLQEELVEGAKKLVLGVSETGGSSTKYVKAG